jgi:hypothetical protein
VNEASAVFDLDGPGGDPPTTIGPAFDDVQIVEVLALPPLGDGPAAAASGSGAGAAAAAVIAIAVAAALGGGLLLRREEADAA